MLAVKQKQVKRPMPKNPYLVQKVMSASPEQLIAYIYDAGIAACIQKDRDKALRAIQILIHSLNFDHEDAAIAFYNVYRYMNYSVSSGKFTEAKRYFETLKSTWAQGMKVV